MSKPNEDKSQKEAPQPSQPLQPSQTSPDVIVTTKPNGIVITNYVGEAD